VRVEVRPGGRTGRSHVGPGTRCAKISNSGDAHAKRLERRSEEHRVAMTRDVLRHRQSCFARADLSGLMADYLVDAWSRLTPGRVFDSIGYATGSPATFPPYATVVPRRSLVAMGDGRTPLGWRRHEWRGPRPPRASRGRGRSIPTSRAADRGSSFPMRSRCCRSKISGKAVLRVDQRGAHRARHAEGDPRVLCLGAIGDQSLT
jgi:hypothetical protein